MRYMYTNKPDDTCHEINGVYGRPVFLQEEAKLKKLGWTLNANQLQQTKSEEVKEAEEEAVLSRDELAESLGISLVDEEGKKRHYKLIQADIEKAQADEHNES